MNLTALRTIKLSPKKTVRRGEAFEVSAGLGARYLRLGAAEETSAEPEVAGEGEVLIGFTPGGSFTVGADEVVEVRKPAEPEAPRRQRSPKSPA